MKKQKILKVFFMILIFIALFALGYWLGKNCKNYFEKLIAYFFMWLGNG